MHHSSICTHLASSIEQNSTMTMKFLVLVVCLIGLCSSIPVSNEQVREERSSSNERYRGFGGYNPYQQPQYPQYYPYAQQPQSNSELMALLPLLLARGK
ncbi:hypothetical protein DPEC_G00192490 [Dallia pectoralis]|uniref:Uncharacterized protein n=1 Tax=Dallia pectoralis TaxID=75939 RepID=A0ACC2GC90_DALPE|nr:hypothetical protein DPEC_G00192490 [Dallia pectoralis]